MCTYQGALSNYAETNAAATAIDLSAFEPLVQVDRAQGGVAPVCGGEAMEKGVTPSSQVEPACQKEGGKTERYRGRRCPAFFNLEPTRHGRKEGGG